jgi:thiosulfate/3-mercaptopyruvate sulfurtransferase
MTDNRVSGYARPELLATPRWLCDNLDRPGFGVLDVRWRPDGSGRKLYSTGHIPGACYLDWRHDLSEEDEHTDVLLLAGPHRVVEVLTRAGIGNGMAAIIYDDTASSYAARTWWTLRVYGLDSARILTGGFDAWRGLGLPTSSTAELRPPTTFTPRLDPRARLTASDVKQLLGSPAIQLVDARTPDEFAGYSGTARRLGHIPGAINLPAAATTEPGTGEIRPADELKTLVRKAGISPRRRLICYDSTGIGASKLAFILALLGYDGVGVFEAGWTEWADRLDLPVEV